jgi:hypothetical protein
VARARARSRRRRIRLVEETNHIQDLLRRLQILASAPEPEPLTEHPAHKDVFQGAQSGKGPGRLEGPPDPAVTDLMGVAPGDLLAGKKDPSRGRLHATADEVEKGGLSGAVRPDEADDLALRHSEMEISQGPHLAELSS